jgi:thioglycine synthase
LHLKSTKKYQATHIGTSSRTKPEEETLAEVIPLSKKIGVTRISDITFMDKLAIPNYSVTLPCTIDTIWVYGGKGITKVQAMTSALMESVERYSSLSSFYLGGFIQGTHSQLSKSYNKVLHPAEVIEPVSEMYNGKTSVLGFLPGFDLLKNETVLVPAQLALYRYEAKSPLVNAFPFSHTNGLASGNTLEEAICHALCEVIERDAVSIADLCSSFIPYTVLERIRNGFLQSLPPSLQIPQIPDTKFVDDSTIFPDVDVSELAQDFEAVRILLRKFDDHGIPLLIKNITTSDIPIPTFVASSVEWISHDYGYFAKGFGTNPDPRIALIRAITEVSQTRALNIQGARDDLKKISYTQDDQISKKKWQFMRTSSLMNQQENMKFSEIKAYSRSDLLDDIKLILDHLRKAGLKRAIIVNLTNPSLGIPVVRAIVPGLETFEVAKLFMDSQSVMGRRAKKAFIDVLGK